MAHITGKDRSQLLLLPDAVDDYVGPDNPVRFIDAFVDSLDLEAAGALVSVQPLQDPPRDTGCQLRQSGGLPDKRPTAWTSHTLWIVFEKNASWSCHIPKADIVVIRCLRLIVL